MFKNTTTHESTSSAIYQLSRILRTKPSYLMLLKIKKTFCSQNIKKRELMTKVFMLDAAVRENFQTAAIMRENVKLSSFWSGIKENPVISD